MTPTYDIAVVGSGFAGSLFAMIARRLGRSVVLLERGRHPRVVIGESSTPLSNLLLEDVARRYDLPRVGELAKWGSWQRGRPELACGLKRGFSFYHHDLERPVRGGLEQLLVAASPHDEIADTHWYRADVDAFLMEEARRLGADYVDEVALESCVERDEEVVLSGCRSGARVEYRVRFVVDATGPRGFLHRALGLEEAELPGYPGTRALYGHFSGVRRMGELPGFRGGALYPVDDAAVHHVFDGGWVWVLRFNNGVTSAGVAATERCAERLGLSEGEAAWRRLLAKIPLLEEQFAGAKLERPFTYVPRLSFRSSAMVGRRWAMLPSAAGFVDPLLSTGFPLTLLGVTRLAEIVESGWGCDTFAGLLRGYAEISEQELLATARLIGALYAGMAKFDVFRAVSLLYFAVASFSETARRLGRPELARSFLLQNDARFGAGTRELLERLSGGVAMDASEVMREVQRVIAPFDVAGLGKRQPGWCYPVVAEDLLDGAWKVGASRGEAMAMMERAGFFVARS